MSIFHIPTQSDVPSTGWWGPATSVHQFCEPKYATSPYFAEFYNSLSSFIFVVAAAYMLSKPETRKDPLILLTILSVAAIGLGSVAFHATMLFEYELCDEVPMLIMIGLALLNKCHAHPLLLTRGRCAAYTACVTTAIGITIWIYAKLALYDFFVASFTALVVADTARTLTDPRAGDGEDEARRVDRLADNASDAGDISKLATGKRQVGGADDDRCFAVGSETAHVPRERDTANFRHHEVQHHDIEAAAVEPAQRLGAGAAGLNPMPDRSQDGAQDVEVAVIVIDHQNVPRSGEADPVRCPMIKRRRAIVRHGLA